MNPALALALSRVLPTPEQTLLLRACLYSGEAGRDAWADYQRGGPNLLDLLRDGPTDVRRLGPLLFVALRDSGAPVDKAQQTVLRTSYLREEMRSRQYRQVGSVVLSALTAARIPFVVFRGAALGETIYGDQALRHSHDINVLVPGAEQAAAVEVLGRRACTPRAAVEADAVTLDHESGLPVLVHSRFFRISFYRLDWDELWPRAGQAAIAGRMASVLSPGDALLHACCQSSQAIRLQPFGWAADAYLIVQRNPDLSWTELLRSVARSRAAIPAYAGLAYLARELRAPIPGSVLDQLASATMTVEPVERDVALLAARSREGMRVRALLRGDATARVKLTSLRWLLLPSPGYLRWAYGRRGTGLLPLVYLERIGRYLARRIWRRLGRRGAGNGPRSGNGTRRDEHRLPVAPA